MTAPRAPWLTPDQAARVPYGTPLAVEPQSHRGPRTRGRLTAVIGPLLYLDTCGPDRSVTVDTTGIDRVRVITAVLEDGDLVVRRGVSADDWRGGVIRTEGTRVLVESTEGVLWIEEADLVRADLAPRPPRARTGRIGADRSVELAAEAASTPL